MSRIISNFKIERKNILYDNLSENYKKEIDLSQEKPIQSNQQDPYENMIMFEFNNNVEIFKNGQKIERNNYYSDFNSNVNKINNFNQKQHIQPTNDFVEQVDPNTFFGNSLNGIIQNFKK